MVTVVVNLYADLSALNEVRDSFKNVGHLTHHPETFFKQKHQLFVLGSTGALVIGRDIVVVGQRLLVALDGDRVIFALEPPTKNILRKISNFRKLTVFYLHFLFVGAFIFNSWGHWGPIKNRFIDRVRLNPYINFKLTYIDSSCPIGRISSSLVNRLNKVLANRPLFLCSSYQCRLLTDRNTYQ